MLVPPLAGLSSDEEGTWEAEDEQTEAWLATEVESFKSTLIERVRLFQVASSCCVPSQ